MLKRFARTLVPAAIGALAGFVYAKESLTTEVFENSALPGLYTTAGAAIAILAVRLIGIAIWFVRELKGDSKTPGDDEPS